MRADVAVVGGGCAGIAAAVSAARSGARVVLIERRGMLGGQVAGALIHSICGLYLLRENESQPLIPANSGFPMEFANRLLEAGGARGPVRMGRLDVLLHEPAAFASLAGRLCADVPGLEIRLHTEILEASSGGGMILGLNSPGRRAQLETAAVVDATGDAEVAVLTGADWTQAPADKLQRPAYIFKLDGVPASALSGDERIRIARALSAAVTDGILPASALGAAFRGGATEGEAWGTMDLAAVGFAPNGSASGQLGNVERPSRGPSSPGKAGDSPAPLFPNLAAFDPCDALQLAAIENEGRDAALRIVRFLRGTMPGFLRATLAELPARAGIRESRRISGRYELSTDDIRDGATFADSVARTAWPMELREKPTGPKFRFPSENRPCGIPLRALRSRNVEALFMAGRCISCSHEAQASIRVIGTCLATGEAAGKAAALHAAG